MTTSTVGLVSDRRLTLISVVLVLGAIASILDTTIVNVALDHLHEVFGASVADTQWVVTAYLLALAGVIPLTAWASERFGSRRMWMTAVAVFLGGSVLCGLSWSLPSLIAFRVLQGIGGGMILPITVTLLTQAAGPARIGRAMAAIALPGQLGPILGPVIGGAIVDSVGWNWLFFVNVPVCLAALALAPSLLPAGVRSPGHPLDWRGFLLLTPGLIVLAYGISQAGGPDGFGATDAWLPMVAGAAFIGCFAVYSLLVRRRTPLIDVRLFARRSFGLASVMTFVAGFSSYAAMLLLPLFYQVARGESAFATGLLLIPQGVGTMLFIVFMGRLTKVFGHRTVVIGGVVLTMIGLLPFVFAGASGNEVLLLAGQFVRGVGMGASTVPIMTLAFASLEAPEVPRASAAFNIVQRVGAPFGTTVVAVLLASYLAGAGTPAAVSGAFNASFIWVIAFSLVPLVLGFFLPKLRTPATPAAAAPASASASVESAVDDARALAE
jgi:EmrB/QacA subfamily drug resistance transporter